ncbi:hypothetical protein CNECB9_1850003 [Cupriavidus necator]|uniref:Uncharacterized protein n=1 Tax=Cupriavidus necator TaxID=106590 RepID=A0A1K0ICG0_CUPNE|nr:hypothetical protein CNECB9_1850003 [Cupriavidus necator]
MQGFSRGSLLIACRGRAYRAAHRALLNEDPRLDTAQGQFLPGVLAGQVPQPGWRESTAATCA